MIILSGINNPLIKTTEKSKTHYQNFYRANSYYHKLLLVERTGKSLLNICKVYQVIHLYPSTKFNSFINFP